MILILNDSDILIYRYIYIIIYIIYRRYRIYIVIDGDQ